MEHRGYCTAGVSTVNNTYKALMNLTELGKIVKEGNYFRLPTCESQYKDHARLLTNTLAEMYCLNCELTVHRERLIEEKGLRPDAMVLLTRNGEGRCVILEVLENETEEYFRSKVRVWNNWNEATESLQRNFRRNRNSLGMILALRMFTGWGTLSINRTVLKERG